MTIFGGRWKAAVSGTLSPGMGIDGRNQWVNSGCALAAWL